MTPTISFFDANTLTLLKLRELANNNAMCESQVKIVCVSNDCWKLTCS